MEKHGMLIRLISIIWFLMELTVSNGSDVLMKLIGERLDPYQISFFRFAFSFLILLPFIILKTDKFSIRTPYHKIHIMRALVFALATVFWIIGLNVVELTMATSISFMPF